MTTDYRDYQERGDYLLRNVPLALRERAKLRAAVEGTTIRRVLLRALIEFVDRPPTTGGSNGAETPPLQ